MTILIFTLGASLGSFLGLVLDRFPQHSIISPGSYCQTCQTPLAIWDLIPIVSQIASKSRCRYCQVKLPLTYLLMEIFCGGLALLVYSGLLSYRHGILLAVSLVLSLYDLREHSYPLTIWLLVFIPYFLMTPWSWTCLTLLLLGLLAEWKDINMGSGDFFYLSLLSLNLSFEKLLWLIQIASLLGMLAFAIKKGKELPFVPYLSFAYFIVLFIP
ncbi:prepilin peptidase [Streptococcus hyovaginalis]|uniref:prepilin peptidase n=1 Tax=Streptococcus hyovaginalis TaxID=149015 RepID=UPI003AEC2A25